MKNNNNPHAKLSPSSSDRWLNCLGSIKAEEGYDDTTSAYAEEGTTAHELAHKCLSSFSPYAKEASFYIGKTINNQEIGKEMVNYVQEYVDYVDSYQTKDTIGFFEEKLNMSDFIPGGFGTLDACVVDYASDVCHIFDFKYGRGVEVSAINNTQLKLYALGVMHKLKGTQPSIDTYKLHIIQPRLKNYSTWDISDDDLWDFEIMVKAQARKALQPDAPRTPGEKQCRWCKAKGDCSELSKFTEKTIMHNFKDLNENKLNSNNLLDEEKKNILDNKKLIESFLKAVEDSVFDKLSAGESFDGYKLVEGRSNRKWKDEAEDFLFKKLGDKVYKKSLIGITDAQKLLDKNEMANLVFKPEGRPTLVKSDDKRKEILKGINLFENIENKLK